MRYPPRLKMEPKGNSEAAPATATTGRYQKERELIQVSIKRVLNKLTLVMLVEVTPVSAGTDKVSRIVQADPFQYLALSTPLQIQRKEPPAVVVLTDCQAAFVTTVETAEIAPPAVIS
jgi:hypothetical protein